MQLFKQSALHLYPFWITILIFEKEGISSLLFGCFFWTNPNTTRDSGTFSL